MGGKANESGFLSNILKIYFHPYFFFPISLSCISQSTYTKSIFSETYFMPHDKLSIFFAENGHLFLGSTYPIAKMTKKCISGQPPNEISVLGDKLCDKVCNPIPFFDRDRSKAPKQKNLQIFKNLLSSIIKMSSE